MNESQNIEYKLNWRDEYLKWIAGFANASGGKIYIGLDDTGKAVGLTNVHKLMDILKTKYLISPINYEGLQRIEKLEVPEMALREVIFNAIIHKDYTGAPIQLSVYNQKLILWNEGRLPDDFTIETLLGKHPSRPFNKNVADIFFKAGFIEAWGRGIAKITNGFKNEGLKILAFETTMGGIMVTIERPNYNLKDRDTDIDTNRDTDNVTGNVTNKVPNKVPDNLTENQQKILKLVAQNKTVSMSEIAENIGISKRKVLDNINKLKNCGLTERIGSPKGGHWEIIN